MRNFDFVTKRFSTIGKNVIMLLFSNFFVFLFTFFAITFVNRNLSPVEYGTFSLIAFYLIISQTITDFGLNINGVKYVVNKKYTEGEIVWNIWYSKVLVFLISTPILLLGAYLIHILYPSVIGKIDRQPNLLILYIGVALINVILLSTKSTIDILQQVRHENQYKAISEAVAALVKLVLFMLIVVLGQVTIMSFVLGILISSIFGVLINWVMYRRKISKFVSPDSRIIRFLFKATVFTALLMISNYMLGEVNKIVLDVVQTPYEVGIYATPQKIFAIAMIIPNVIMIPVYSEITRFVEKDMQLRNIIKKTILVLLTISVFATVFTYFIAPFVITFMGGVEYVGSIPVLRVISLSFPPMFLHHLFGYVLIAKNKEKQYFILSMFFVLICTVSAFMFGGSYGALGMAWVLVVVELGICIGSFLLIKS